jgi:type IV pilus assembly protein PilA
MKDHGFSLIELLIVVAIILIIAAIAIPNLIHSKMAANEASAVGSIRAINSSVVLYQTAYIGYPATLAQLGGSGGSATCNSAQLIDELLAGGTKSGYKVAIVPGIVPVAQAAVPSGCTPGYTDGYVVTANPVTIGTTGQRAFCSDSSGLIRVNPTGTATYIPPNCDASQSPLQ